VEDAVSRGTAAELTCADVLTSLHELGIESLEELADRLLQKVKLESSPETRSPRPIDLNLLRRGRSTELEATLQHRVPQVPFVWNGVEYDPDDIRRFNGKAIAYVASPTESRDIRLLVIDDIELVRTWLENRYVNAVMNSVAAIGFTGPPSGAHTTVDLPWLDGDVPAQPPPPPALPATVIVYEHALSWALWPHWPSGTPVGPTLYGGRTIVANPGEMYSDLTEISLDWPFSDWNDRISAISATASRCEFWDHHNFQGDVLLFGPSSSPIWNLETIGWNDRISSFVNYG
jgi:hypothetical protein